MFPIRIFSALASRQLPSVGGETRRNGYGRPTVRGLVAIFVCLTSGVLGQGTRQSRKEPGFVRARSSSWREVTSQGSKPS